MNEFVIREQLHGSFGNVALLTLAACYSPCQTGTFDATLHGRSRKTLSVPAYADGDAVGAPHCPVSDTAARVGEELHLVQIWAELFDRATAGRAEQTVQGEKRFLHLFALMPCTMPAHGELNRYFNPHFMASQMI